MTTSNKNAKLAALRGLEESLDAHRRASHAHSGKRWFRLNVLARWIRHPFGTFREGGRDPYCAAWV